MLLTEMGHVKPTTPAVIESATGDGFVNNNIHQRSSRDIDMIFYLVRDRVRQYKFLLYWVAGDHNIADYFTKHHSTTHHWLKRSTYIIPTEDSINYA